mgnify:CR=1 FL=1
MFVTKAERERRGLVGRRSYLQMQKAARGCLLRVGLLDQGFRIGRGGVSRIATETSVGIDQRTAGELLDAAERDRMVMTMPIPDDAVFSIPAAKLSIGYNPRWIRPMLSVVTAAKAKEMLFTGRRYGAAEAYDMGIANAVVRSAELEAETRKVALEMALNAPLSLRAAKEAIDEMTANPENPDMARLDRFVEACFESEDYAEGRRAFMEKRKPVFRGR